MSFLNPSALFWLLPAIPIVIFFLLKMRTRRVTVGSVMFWNQVAQEKPPRAIWLQLRHIVTLLVQLLLLVLLVFSLADPVWLASNEQSPCTVVVLDNSASMRAPDGSGTRFDQALDAVKRRINGLNGRQEMAIVTTARPAQVLCGLTSHAGVLRQALSEVRCTETPTAMDEAIAMAEQLRGHRTDALIEALTDGSGWRSSGSGGTAAESVSVSVLGEAIDNVAITGLQVRRSFRDPLTWQALVQLQSFSDTPQSGSLELLLGEELLDVVTLELDADERWENVFEFRAAAGGVVSVSLSDVDQFGVDDRAVAILPPRPPVAITLVTRGQWFLEQVLSANALVELTVTAQQSDAAPEILVLHKTAPEEIPAGPVIVVQPENDTSLWRLEGVVESPLVGQQKNDDLTRNVQLDNVLMPTAASLKPLGEHDVLIASAGGTPLFVRFPRPDGDVVVLNISLDDSDLPLRTAFPILLGNTIAAMSGSTQDIAHAVPTGTAVRFRGQWGGDEADSMELTGPSGTSVRAIRSGEQWIVAPLTESGVYTLTTPSDSEADQSSAAAAAVPVLACNLFDAVESDLRPTATDASAALSIQRSGRGRPVWWQVVCLLLLLLVIEWAAFHRRWLT